MPVDTVTQQKTILKVLHKKPHNTLELRELNIFSPNPRILELRQFGFSIDTRWIKIYDDDGEEHRIGEYHYSPKYDDLTDRGKVLKKWLFKGKDQKEGKK